MSFLVCEDDRQNRTRELMSGVALKAKSVHDFRRTKEWLTHG